MIMLLSGGVSFDVPEGLDQAASGTENSFRFV